MLGFGGYSYFKLQKPPPGKASPDVKLDDPEAKGSLPMSAKASDPEESYPLVARRGEHGWTHVNGAAR